MRVTAGQQEYGHGKCSRCAMIIPLEQFRQWRGEDGELFRSRKCKICESGPIRMVTEQQRLAGQLNGRGEMYYHKKNMIQQAKAKPCADCGQLFPPMCMEFDHLPRYKKEYNIASMMNHSVELIRAEIAKCDVVCACCHRIRSHARGWSGGRKPKLSTAGT